MTKGQKRFGTFQAKIAKTGNLHKNTFSVHHHPLYTKREDFLEICFFFLRGKRRRQKRHKIILRLRLGSSRKMRQRILETIRKVTTGNNKTFPFLIAVAMNSLTWRKSLEND